MCTDNPYTGNVMRRTAEELKEVGLEVVDLTDETPILRRRLHSRSGAIQMEGLQRLAVAFVEQPDTTCKSS